MLLAHAVFCALYTGVLFTDSDETFGATPAFLRELTPLRRTTSEQHLVLPSLTQLRTYAALQHRVAASKHHRAAVEQLLEVVEAEAIRPRNASAAAVAVAILSRYARSTTTQANAADSHILAEARDFLADVALRTLRRASAARTLDASQSAVEVEQRALRVAIGHLHSAADAHALLSGQVRGQEVSEEEEEEDLVRVSEEEEWMGDGTDGADEAAMLHIETSLERLRLRAELYRYATGPIVAGKPSPKVAKYFQHKKCFALVGSPPQRIVLLREAHRRSKLNQLRWGDRRRVTAAMLRGASANNRREMNELAFVLAYMTGRSLQVSVTCF